MRLRRTSPDERGWTRRRAGRGFSYVDHRGERLRPDQVQRIKALAIPPAWEDVWISPRENGHLQAVGTDESGRRQYLYHPQWRARRDAEKFERVHAWARTLPRLRDRAIEDLQRNGMPWQRAAGVAVRMLDLGYFRIGSDVYADNHGTVGLTTLTRRHVRAHGDELVFSFTGKSGVEHVITIDDELTVACLRDMRRRRGGFDELLAYKDGRTWRRLTPDMVNTYIRETSGTSASAKDFRTWHATVLAAIALSGDGNDVSTRTDRNRRRREALEEVARYLGNTPAVARNSYVDPRVIDLFDEGHVIRVRSGGRDGRATQEAAERALRALLKRHG